MSKKTNNIVVTDHGDPSTGVFPTQFSIIGDLAFESESDLTEFCDRIASVFAECLCFDLPTVETIEQHNAD